MASVNTTGWLPDRIGSGAVGALKLLNARHGELKSMHTADAHPGPGPFGDYRPSRYSTFLIMEL